MNAICHVEHTYLLYAIFIATFMDKNNYISICTSSILPHGGF